LCCPFRGCPLQPFIMKVYRINLIISS
jgi:hypothetical protein